MEAKVKTDYQIVENKSYEVSIDIDFEQYAKDQELTIESKFDLELEIVDFICDLSVCCVSPDHVDLVGDYSEEREVLNIDELVEQYAYLIKVDNCCQQAPEDAKYCPTCGKRIRR